MKHDGADAAAEWLRRVGNLAEALLSRLELANHGYAVHLVFSPVIDAATGRALDAPRDVRLELDGVQRLLFVGGLNESMLRHPERIDWGLSEVASVSVSRSGGGVHCEVLWEDSRRIEAECHRVSLVAEEFANDEPILVPTAALDAMSLPSPGDPADAPVWENYVVAKLSRPCLVRSRLTRSRWP